MDIPPLTYLSADPVTHGVGASQVLPYVEALARRGMTVTLHSLEQEAPAPAIAHRLDLAGVRWVPHRWGGAGHAAGLARVLRGATFLRGSPLVHARSDLPAGSALLARCPAWVWDMRGFWADERIAAGLLRPGSAQERIMRAIERGSARRAGAIVTLAETALDVLVERHGAAVRDKAQVIATCVDLDRFTVSPMPSPSPLRVLLAGTLNPRYDVPLMLRLVEQLRRRRPVELVALVPAASPWDDLLRSAGVKPGAVNGADMPVQVAASHVGLSVLSAAGGVSLKASMPTKVGEFLASGRPVVVNAGLGDLDRLLAGNDCGVVVADGDGLLRLEKTVEEIERLVDDPGTPARCRALAERHFDLETGVSTLLSVYRRAVIARDG